MRIEKIDTQNMNGAPDIKEDIPPEANNTIINEAEVKTMPGLIDVPESQHLPFRRLSQHDIKGCLEKKISYQEEKKIEHADFTEQEAFRHRHFKHLLLEDQEAIEKALVQSACNSGFYTSHLLFLTGRETDRLYIHELEQRFKVNLDALRVYIEAIDMEYNVLRLWEAMRDEQIDLDASEYRPLIRQVKKSAKELAKYRVLAIHKTSGVGGRILKEGEKSSYEQIKYTGVVQKSVNWPTRGHALGEGIYMGLMGSRVNKNQDAENFEFRLPLRDAVTTITIPSELWCVVPGEHITLRPEDPLEPKISRGVVQWYQGSEDHMSGEVGEEKWQYHLPQWKIQAFAEGLGLKRGDIHICYDQDNLPCLVANTNEAAIVWGSLCNALNIRRFIPLNELAKVKEPYDDEGIYYIHFQAIQKAILKEPVEPEEYYENLSSRAIKKRHIKSN